MIKNKSEGGVVLRASRERGGYSGCYNKDGTSWNQRLRLGNKILKLRTFSKLNEDNFFQEAVAGKIRTTAIDVLSYARPATRGSKQDLNMGTERRKTRFIEVEVESKGRRSCVYTILVELVRLYGDDLCNPGPTLKPHARA
jgi:hypothetical protein